MNLWERQIDYVEKRYFDNKKQRELRAENLKKGNWLEVDNPNRIRFRMEQVGMREEIVDSMTEIEPETGLPKLNVLERILGLSQLRTVYFLQKGAAVSHAVGRVVIRDQTGSRVGYGTGFMVSPRLMMTNHHVLEKEEMASNSIIQFNYQENFAGEISEIEEFALQPEIFFKADEFLDFALVAVNPTNSAEKLLHDFGWMHLIAESGKAIVGERVNIIQHPGGRPKHVALRENTIIDILDKFLHYETDTEPGSSGSPVLNDQWEVAALHHSGVPAKKDGKILLVDDQPWDGSRQKMHLIKWVANEGIRISFIVKYIQELGLSEEEKQMFNEALSPDPRIEASTTSSLLKRIEEGSVLQPGMQLEPDGSVTWFMKMNFGPVGPQGGGGTNIPLSISTSPDIKTVKHTEPSKYDIEDVEEEAISIDPDYSNRKGYDPKFLGSGDKQVPLPEITDEMKKATAINQQSTIPNDFVLPYHHYSVIINGKRRLAWITAVNIDGKAFRPITRETDKWIYDPRIKRSEQVGNELYKYNRLDRGHLVRRLDPVWGSTKALAKVANDDTFHYTNCSPQHQDFNRRDTTWQGLEDYILTNAEAKDLKLSVFTGPVFRDDDQTYRNIKIPKEFWKVVVMVKPNDELSATAYLLSQESLIQDLEEEFVYGKYKTFQVPVLKIGSLTGLEFGKLKDCDPMAEDEEDSTIEISGAENLKF